MSKTKTDKSAENKPQEENQKKEPGFRFQEQLEDLQVQVKQAEEKAEDNWQKALRALAEVENIKRRSQKELSQAHQFGLESFIKNLLPALDSIEKALEVEGESEAFTAMQKGVELTQKLLHDAMHKVGLVAVNPKGEAFNPELHEAMTMVESPDVESHTIIDVIQTGYLLNERLVRPARVVVAK